MQEQGVVGTAPSDVAQFLARTQGLRCAGGRGVGGLLRGCCRFSAELPLWHRGCRCPCCRCALCLGTVIWRTPSPLLPVSLCLPVLAARR